MNLPADISLERHYSVSEVAAMWGVSYMTVQRLFQNEPGVLVFGSDETRWSRKRKTMRIPESVLMRVHRSHRSAENQSQIRRSNVKREKTDATDVLQVAKSIRQRLA